MKWFFLLYVIPGIVVTGLFTPFIKAQGGDDFLRFGLPSYRPEHYSTILAFVTFCPIANFFLALTLLTWYVFEIFN